MDPSAPARFRPDATSPGAAFLLGYAGLLPFAGLAIALATDLVQPQAVRWFISYSAVILSFLGGIRWGVCAAASTPSDRDLWIGIAVSLAAWGACQLTPVQAVSTLLGAHLATVVVDQMMPPRGQQPWLTALRLRLSSGAIVAHILVLALYP